jgi:hypothetical protein
VSTIEELLGRKSSGSGLENPEYSHGDPSCLPCGTLYPQKLALGRLRHRWVDNIKMEVLDIGWDGVDWSGLAQDSYRRRALVNAVMNLRVP